jgi:ArsR family transcriptional regulator, lead/cadmium/zinc/bismuth-responsive transcriptional repressor
MKAYGRLGHMHLIPTERAGQAVIDGHRACDALAALGNVSLIESWADRFALLADPRRLALLVCIKGAGPISVTDLAVATGMNATAVSQALRLLRAAGVVAAHRDGRVIRYTLTDPAVGSLLARVAVTG